ncbi:MAG: GAF domain-containing protein [Candidatus Omnitrophica bacterium]|nr:GAF domain-containing protein [Candidatus Omnitrophota bacterium]
MFSFNIFVISNAILFITSFLLFLLLIKFGKTFTHKMWSFFNLAVAIWGFGGFWAGGLQSQDLSFLWWKISHIGVIFIPITLFHSISLFCNVKKTWIFFLVYFQGLIFLFFNFIPNNLFFVNMKYVFSSFYYPVLGPAYHIFFLLWIIIVILAHYLLLIEYFSAKEIKKKQILYLFFGVSIGFSGGLTNFLVGYINVYPFGNFGIPLYCLIVTYAILRYRLLDIKLIITRTGIFVAIYSLVLGIPFIIAYVFQPYFIGLLGDKWWLGPMGLLTVLATVGPFVYIYIDRKAEDRLLREQRQYQNTLRQASSGMIRVRELKRLLNLIVHVVTRTVKLEFASIFLLDAENGRYKMAAKRDSSRLPKDLALNIDSTLIEQIHLRKEPIVYEEVLLQAQDDPRDSRKVALEKQLKEINAAVVIPSYVGNKLLGFIVLGKKLSGKIYSQDDLNVFSVLANQAALAIENAQFYEDIKKTQEQLFQAEKMATIGTMADGLSHQVNNRFQALSLISGDSLDILKTTDISACSNEVKEAFGQLKYAFERVQSNVMQGGEIVRGLLKYSRPGQSGFEAVDFNQVIDGALEMAQYKVRLNELDIERNISKDLPKIKCNLTQLEEIFFNLIDNAYDAIKERQFLNKDADLKGKIIISAEKEDDYMRIIFEDNGIGVKNKDKEKLFTPFFTTKASHKKGMGLGLYVIQKIAGFHNGTVSIDSTYNKGTRFEIVLPLTKQ